MRIFKTWDEIEAAAPGVKFPDRTAVFDRLLQELNAPIELGRMVKLAHDQKTDRYSATFHPQDTTVMVFKVSNDVAKFLAEHTTGFAGYWRGRMEEGEIVDIYLITN